MACPYFYPVERFEDRDWPGAPRLPLGDPYHGMCCVQPTRETRPDPEILRQYCNLGYARGKCSRFPNEAGPDALRFMVAGEQDGAVRLFYVVEKDHAPVEHGPMEYSLEQGRFVEGPSNDLLRRQAQAYIESYLRRRTDPQARAHNPHRR